MENSQNLLTIKAFAKASGRSQQTIYKQIGTRLAPFVREIDGQKYIEHRALMEVFGIDAEQPTQPRENNSFNSENNPEHELYTILREELAAKNGQIERLQAQLDEQIQINKELAQSINADRKNELAGTIREMLPDGEVTEAAGEAVELVQDEVGPEPAKDLTGAQNGLQEAVKGLSFAEKLKLLFGRKERI